MDILFQASEKAIGLRMSASVPNLESKSRNRNRLFYNINCACSRETEISFTRICALPPRPFHSKSYKMKVSIQSKALLYLAKIVFMLLSFNH